MVSVYRSRLRNGVYGQALRIANRDEIKLTESPSSGGQVTTMLSRRQAAIMIRRMRHDDDFEHNHIYD